MELERERSGEGMSQSRIMRAISVALAGIVVALGLSTVNPGFASASAFTPLEWRQEIAEDAPLLFRGQRKFLNWNRDKDHDFIDDEIKIRFKPSQRVNVIVDLNECLPPSAAQEQFSKFGRITYIGKLITIILLDNVPVKLLPQLAALSTVAMVEWQVPVSPSTSVSSRAIQARTSNTYGAGSSAQAKSLTGAGVTIAVIDSGVDSTHRAFTGKFVHGYDATTGNEITSPSNLDALGHGTLTAGIALGLPASNVKHSDPTVIYPPPASPDDATPVEYSGVAPAAKLVDIKVCDGVVRAPANQCPALIQGLEWLGLNAETFNVRVANISLETKCMNYTGDDLDATALLVNRLVSLGIAVAISHGNADPTVSGCNIGARITPSPGSSSFAMTVAAVEDPWNSPQKTVNRNNDEPYNGRLSGPRDDFFLDPMNPMPTPKPNPNFLALKPDFSAPGKDVVSAAAGTLDKYDFFSGTSMAAPHVAGAAALVLEAQPSIDPGSLKDLLRYTADSSQNGGAAYPSIDPVWQENLGAGIIDVNQALSQMKQNDVGFANCVGPPTTIGGLCQVTSPQPPWDNTFDIVTVDPSTGNPAIPKKGIPILIKAQVRHNTSNGTSATVLVNFGVYEFGVGSKQFYHIGTARQVIPAGGTVWISQPWTPQDANHQCIQISIQYGLDSDFGNNITQRNLEVKASVYNVRIENPFTVPAQIRFIAKSDREGWKCRVNKDAFAIDSLTDCPRNLRVAFDAPPGILPGERANCDIAVYGTPEGSDHPILMGGVTVQTFVPKPCRIIGQVVDRTNTPVPKADLVFSQALPKDVPVSRAERPPVTATTDEDGIFSVYIPPSLNYTILVEQSNIGKGQVEQRLECGIGIKNKYVLTPEGLRLSTREWPEQQE